MCGGNAGGHHSLFLRPVFYGQRVAAKLTGEGHLQDIRSHPSSDPSGHLVPVKNGEKGWLDDVELCGLRPLLAGSRVTRRRSHSSRRCPSNRNNHPGF